MNVLYQPNHTAQQVNQIEKFWYVFSLENVAIFVQAHDCCMLCAFQNFVRAKNQKKTKNKFYIFYLSYDCVCTFSGDVCLYFEIYSTFPLVRRMALYCGLVIMFQISSHKLQFAFYINAIGNFQFAWLKIHTETECVKEGKRVCLETTATKNPLKTIVSKWNGWCDTYLDLYLDGFRL